MPGNGRGIALGIFSHLLSAGLGILVGIAVIQYTTTTPELVYETFPPTDFASQTTQLSIYNVRVENVGDKEAENVQVRFELSLPTTIDELQVEPSLKSISYEVFPTAGQNIREVIFPRLNPGESSRFSILSNDRQDTPLEIEVRAKGIIGHMEREQTSEVSFNAAVAGVVTAALGSILVMVWGFLRITRENAIEMYKMRHYRDALQLVTRNRAREDDLPKMLLSTRYRLFFNPAVPGLAKTKIMKFGDDGRILEGKNDNETTWRIRQGLLELVDKNENVHSRFYYSADDKRFFHTNDPDTGSIQKHGIRDQYMIPAE